MSSSEEDDLLLAASSFLLMKSLIKKEKSKTRRKRRWWMTSLYSNRGVYSGTIHKIQLLNKTIYYLTIYYHYHILIFFSMFQFPFGKFLA